MKNKTILLGALAASLTFGTVAVVIGAKNAGANFFHTHGEETHDASCEWNHYDAVMPSTSGHGSQEFWACCTHAGSYSLEKPASTHVTECGAFAGAYFNSLDSGDARYIPQLEVASTVDTIAPITVSDMGVTSGSYAKTGSEGHTFLDYNFLEDGGADIWMNYRYSFADGTYDEAAAQIYILNNHSEDGLRIRLDGRIEDDGIAVLYVYSSGQYSNPGTDDDIPSAPAGSAQFFFPRPAQFRSDRDITIHIVLTLIDPVNYVFNVKIEAGSEGTLYQVSTGPEANTYSPRTFNIEMGSGFAGWPNKSLRITAKRSEDIVLSDAESTENVVVYKNAAGEVLGKLTDQATAKLPNLVSDGNTLLGWFDNKGGRVRNGAAVSSKHILTPRYTTTRTNMFVPSDVTNNALAAAKGGWFESTSFAGEAGGQLPVNSVADRFDVYFIYHFVSRSNSDNYAIFGFPFDFLDEQTRLHLRIDNPTNTNLTGYIYGPNSSLGGAGAAGTNFTQAGFRNNGSDLLVHMAVYNASANGLTLAIEIVNLGNGQAFNTTRDLTFNTGGLYGINNPARNVFDLMKANCEYRITDAF